MISHNGIARTARLIIWLAALNALSACGPDLSGLTEGETAVVADAEGPTRLRLDSGLLVFLAEIQAPDAEAERPTQDGLAALTEGRTALLAYGERRRIALRNGEEAALAHVFVKSESGAWVWVQRALVEEGLAIARPRPGETARAATLLPFEAQARDARVGAWADARVQPRSVALFTLEAAQLDSGCNRGPYRLIEGTVDHIGATQTGIYLNFGPPGTEQEDATARILGADLDAWRAAGVDVSALAGATVRLRGPVGYGGGPLLCLEHPLGLERMDEAPLP